MPPRKLESQIAINEPIKLLEVVNPEDEPVQGPIMHSRWRQVLENYTSRKLTHQTDIMAAVAGLDIRFKQSGNTGDDTYVQGLRKNDLVQGLLWYVVQPQSLTKRELAQKTGIDGPSWSWVSVMGKFVTYPFSFARTRSLFSADIKLRIGKPCIDLTIRCPDDSVSYVQPMPMKLEVLGYVKAAKICNCKVKRVCELYATSDSSSRRLGTMISNTQADLVEDREVWVLSMWDSMQVYGRNGIGLVLVPCSAGSDSEDSNDTYCRVGLADTLDLQQFDDSKLRTIFLA